MGGNLWRQHPGGGSSRAVGLSTQARLAPGVRQPATEVEAEAEGRPWPAHLWNGRGTASPGPLRRSLEGSGVWPPPRHPGRGLPAAALSLEGLGSAASPGREAGAERHLQPSGWFAPGRGRRSVSCGRLSVLTQISVRERVWRCRGGRRGWRLAGRPAGRGNPVGLVPVGPGPAALLWAPRP